MGSMGGLLVKPLPNAQRENDLRPPLQDAIYRRGKSSQPVIFLPGQAAFHQTLGGWNASSIIVDNYATQFLFLPEQGIWINPGLLGRVIPVRDVGNMHLVWQAPPGITQPAAGSGPAVIQWFEDAFPPTSGIAVNAV